MVLPVEILDTHAFNLLRELAQMRVIKLLNLPIFQQQTAVMPKRKKEFKAIRLDTSRFKFNREEANERVEYH
jgi:hypothetical protein